MNKIIPIQTEFTRSRDFVRGGPEYDALVHDLDFIADSIRHSGIENVIMQYFVDRASSNVCKKKLKNAKLVKIQKKALFRVCLKIEAFEKKKITAPSGAFFWNETIEKLLFAIKKISH